MAVFKRRRKRKRADGKKILKQSARWYVKYRDAGGIVRCVPGYADKEATKQLEARLEKEAALANEGVVDRFKDHRMRPLGEHLEDFRRFLLAKGDTPKHTELTYSRARAVVTGCGFAMWGDISASKVQQFIAGLRNNGEGLSAQTSNFYLAATKQFCRWMVQGQRAAESPVQHLKGLNVRTDRRHDRRALDVDEVRKLLEVTARAPKRFCMTGPERAMLYRTAVESGLRAGELRSLRVASFDLENCTVEVAAAYSKRRRQDKLPLRPETTADLRVFFAEKLPTAKAFRMPSKSRVANMIKADLADANIPYIDDSGRYADFHGLRHTTGSFLAASGVHPRTAQAIMRHSKVDLTMSIYTHTFRGQESEAVAKLPDLSLPSSESEAAKATGTDAKAVDAVQTGRTELTPQLTPKSTPTAFSEVNRLSLPDTGVSAGEQTQECDKPLEENALGTETADLSPGDTTERNRRRWDSNPRITVLQTVAFGRLATPPRSQKSRAVQTTPPWAPEKVSSTALQVYLELPLGTRNFVGGRSGAHRAGGNPL